jgi:GST-like protein
MIDLYTWRTPNGQKISIALEELGLPYNVCPVDIGKGEQFAPEFLKISPNNRIPAIVDHDGPERKPISLFESGAILLYLAEKTGRLIPADAAGRYLAVQWLMFQVASVGTLLGQAGHFRCHAPEKIPYAIERYTREGERIFGVLDRHLAEVEYLAGEYSIADISMFPWIRCSDYHGVERTQFPNVARWYEAIAKRPAVERGLGPSRPSTMTQMDEQQREVLFGRKQFERPSAAAPRFAPGFNLGPNRAHEKS